MPLDYPNDPVAVYLREIGKVAPVTPEEEKELRRLLQSEAIDEVEAARYRLCEAHLALVVSIAQRQPECAVHILDLIQHGNEAMEAALKSFPLDWPESFSAYASPRIEKAIAEYIVRESQKSE